MTHEQRELTKQANKLLREKGKKGEQYSMPRQPSNVRIVKQKRKRNGN